MNISKIPYLGPITKKLFLATLGICDNNSLKHLKKSTRIHGEKIYSAITELNQYSSKPKHKIIEAIEAERVRLLQDTSTLVDDTLGNAVEHDIGVSIKRACEASKDYKAALFLYFLTKNLNPVNVIELGTNVGISSSYIALALQESANKSHLTTLDASLYRQSHARKIHEKLNFTNIDYVEGFFTDTLEDTLQAMQQPVDLAFIDGHHQYKPTLAYFNQIYKYASKNAVFVFDDIRWSKGMKLAWEELRNDERFDYIVDLYSVGVAVISESASQKPEKYPIIYNKMY